MHRFGLRKLQLILATSEKLSASLRRFASFISDEADRRLWRLCMMQLSGTRTHIGRGSMRPSMSASADGTIAHG